MEENKKITPIIFGASGLLGYRLYQHFLSRNLSPIGTYNQSEKSGLVFFDLEHSQLKDLKIQTNNNYFAIICASLTNISYINENPKETAKINVDATIRLISSLNELNIPILFISSDNVFSGKKGNYSDTSVANPISEYGKQKRIVEVALNEITKGECIILRLAKIISNNANDSSILNDIVSQLQSSKPIKAARDLIFNPTALSDIVRAIELLINKEARGFFNFCNPESFNRLELTKILAEQLEINQCNIQSVLFSDIDESGKRPLNTSMVNSFIFKNHTFMNINECIQSQIKLWKNET
ncbi:sugar nucleotide-binding protein [Marinomonas sp. 2405UD68-3]|uniref:sugar nucleotide-binding protein n=1 Tax=Marinomonas sp. 2405UD68-3 TaxID=3391835 RepID=UPI0039C9B8BD